MVKDHHVIEALGKTKVVIENGEVVSVGEPLVEYCPLFDKIDNAKKLDKDYIKWNMEKTGKGMMLVTLVGIILVMFFVLR